MHTFFVYLGCCLFSDPDADDDGAGALRAVGHDSSNDGAVARAADRKLMKKLVAQRGKHISMWPAQFFHLSVRALRNTLRNPFPFFLHGVTAVVASVLIGFTFQDIHSKDNETAGTQDRFGIMFFLCLYLSLLSLTSLPLWRDDQQLFVSERGSGIYSTSPYVMASMLFDVLPYRILPPLAFALIAYPVIDLNDSPGHQFTFFLILCATNLTTSMICMLIGVLTSSNAAANAAGSLAMLTSLLFCGFLLNKKRIPDGFEWILWWSPGNYAYEALVENEFQGLDGLYITSVLADEVIRAGPFTGSNLAHCFGFEDRVGTDVWTLVIMAGVYFTAVLIVMELFIKEKR
jgi:ABC-type multidrug transport system permease subunit